MMIEAVRSWLGGGFDPAAPAAGAPAVEPRDAGKAAEPREAGKAVEPREAGKEAEPRGAGKAGPTVPEPVEVAGAWPPARIAVVDQLWGEGFTLPGGADETLRLAKPLGLNSSATVLMLGAGGGGPVRTLASTLGVWVSGFEADPALAALAATRSQLAGLAKRGAIQPWNPAAPEFRHSFFQHALAIEPLCGAAPEPVLAALADSLKPQGQFALTELVADIRPGQSGRNGAGELESQWTQWLALEGRQAPPPSEATLSDMLRRLQFDVRISEDISARQERMAIDGWQRVVQALAEGKREPARIKALVAEAERWLLRERLMRAGRLRLIRWHAIRLA